MYLPVYIMVWCVFFFFFNDTATTEIYTLSLHDALPIYSRPGCRGGRAADPTRRGGRRRHHGRRHRHDIRQRRHPGVGDRKSTRLNSSHLVISYAVFCLKKKKTNQPASRTHTHVRAKCPR